MRVVRGKGCGAEGWLWREWCGCEAADDLMAAVLVLTPSPALAGFITGALPLMSATAAGPRRFNDRHIPLTPPAEIGHGNNACVLVLVDQSLLIIGMVCGQLVCPRYSTLWR